MLIKDWIKGLQDELKRLKDINQQGLDPAVRQESQRTVGELSALLRQYQDSKAEILSETDLEPFYRFLRDRWEKMALTGATYSSHPDTLASRYCQVLANNLILIANRIQYKPRDKNHLLMPVSVCSLRVFASEALAALEIQQTSRAQEYSPFASLESQTVLDELQERLKKLSQSEEPVSWNNLSSIIDFLAARFKIIEGSRADYRLNDGTRANVFCKYLANAVFHALKFNQDASHLQNADELLVPASSSLAGWSGDDEQLTALTLKTLKAEEQMPEEAQVLTNRLKKSSEDIRLFAARLLDELNALEKDNIQNMDMAVYLESRRALSTARRLLQNALEKNPRPGGAAIEPFIRFLRERWHLIDGTAASYAESHSAANQFCRVLADHLAITGYQINYLNRNPQRLLQPAIHHDLDQVSANKRLRTAVMQDVKDRDELVAELTGLDKSYWQSYVENIDLEPFIRLMTNGQTSMLDLFNIKELFNENETRSKAILYCFLEIYSRDRGAVASDHTTLGGTIASLFASVPTGKQKNLAVETVKKFLLSGARLSDFDAVLNTPGSELYPHKAVLEDGKLVRFMEQIRLAVSRLPGKATDETLIETARARAVY
ncbi:hypothetical protein AQUSIP_14520 [Aquicella siphonis]|uniref:Uncharacterized protein n=1 Tax=Aquicella siphonis TaxID=254247 RepID=A0A5E4PI94_9COXI|nr:hypothetical protein [Aquicella siphonis]VVC76147.1 hypothetical protein AQUSIP_14520 [Aquicella siphonis]